MTTTKPPRHLAPCWAAAATLLLASQGASTRAELIRYEYGGVITSADPLDRHRPRHPVLGDVRL